MVVQYTGKSVFLMKKLQTLLRRTAGIQVSLQDPLALDKLMTASEHMGNAEALALASALREEQVTTVSSAQKKRPRKEREARGDDPPETVDPQARRESVTMPDVAAPTPLEPAGAECETEAKVLPVLPPILSEQVSPSGAPKMTTLDARVCEVLADYCGPLSDELFKQSWAHLACRDIYQDFDRLIDHLSAGISDQIKRIEFREKCQKLVW